MSYFLIPPVWKLAIYDVERVRKYDTELPHLHIDDDPEDAAALAALIR
jgi:hypothetical protein